MHEDQIEDAVDPENLPNTEETPGIIALLGELKPGAIVTERGLAQMLQRHPTSIKRAVRRGELPPPCRLLGGNAWTAGALVRHVDERLERAAQDAAQQKGLMARKISRLGR